MRLVSSSIINFSRQADCNVLLSANPMHFSLYQHSLFTWARLSSCRRERGISIGKGTHSRAVFLFYLFRVFIMDWDASVAFAMGFVVWLGILGIG